MNITKLNNIVKKENESDPIVLDDLLFIESLVKIILSVDIPKYDFSYKNEVSIENSLYHSLNFARTIDRKYYEQMHLIIQNKKIFYILDDYSKKDIILPALINLENEKIIRLVYNNTISDSYTFTHEAFHYINTILNKTCLNWELMTETISFVAEGLQMKYFEEYSKIFPDYKINEKYNMYAIKIKAYKLDFEINLIKLYIKNGHIDYDDIRLLLIDKSNEYIEAVYDDIEEMTLNNEMNFNSLQRYVVGACLSTHMLQRIKDDYKKINEFIYINDNCYNIEFVETLKMLDLSLKDEKSIILTDSSINLLSKEYKSRVLSLGRG